MQTNIPIETVSVKVMRSHDYCHFEVVLGTTLKNQIDALGVADELRKCAARLADKAVAQYRIAKINAARLMDEKQNRQYLEEQIKNIRNTPEGERTVNEQAKLKAFDDKTWEASRGYDYEDEWQDNQDV